MKVLKPEFRYHRRVGLTLPELMIVILLIGMLVAVTGVRLSGVAQNSKLQWAITQLTNVDSQLRQYLTRDGRTGQLKIDLTENKLVRVYEAEQETTQTIHLGETIQIDRFLSRTQDVSHNQVQVHYATGGVTESFALQLTLPSGQTRWLCFAGLTGKVSQLEKTQDVEELFRSLE